MKKSLTFLLTFAVLMGFAGLALADGGVALTDPLKGVGFVGLICKIVDYIGKIVAALAVLMFVVAGIFYVVSAGDPAKIKRARDILVYAIIGTAIALAASGLITLISGIINAKGGNGCDSGSSLSTGS